MMAETVLIADGQAKAPVCTRGVRVWDPLVRLTHWGIAGGVLLNGFFLGGKGNAHLVIGFIVTAFVVARLFWGLVGTPYARFSAFLPNPFAAIRHLRGLLVGRHRVHLSHNPAGALMAYNLWAALIGMGATGCMMGLPAFSGLTWVKDLHVGLSVWLMVSVVLHLAGVALDSRLTRVPLVQAMIDGRKRVPVGRDHS